MIVMQVSLTHMEDSARAESSAYQGARLRSDDDQDGVQKDVTRPQESDEDSAHLQVPANVLSSLLHRLERLEAREQPSQVCPMSLPMNLSGSCVVLCPFAMKSSSVHVRMCAALYEMCSWLGLRLRPACASPCSDAGLLALVPKRYCFRQ